MKREPSFSSSPTPPTPSPEPELLVTPPKKKARTTPTKTTPNQSKGSLHNGSWTPESKAAFMDEIIAAGYKATDLESLAVKLGLSKRQLIDQLVPNKNNMRHKAVKAVKGE